MNIDLPKGAIVELNQNDKKLYGTTEFMTFIKLLRDTSNAPRVPFGTTAERPTRYVEEGYLFKDNTINKLIMVDSINPIVWVDTMGAVV